MKEFLLKNWPAVIVVITALAVAYNQFNFMAKAVTPETAKRFAVNEATKACNAQMHRYVDDARFCMQTMNDIGACLIRPSEFAVPADPLAQKK